MAKFIENPNDKYKFGDSRPVLWEEGLYFVVPSARGDGFIARRKEWGKLSGRIHWTLLDALKEIEEFIRDEVCDTDDLYDGGY